MSRHDGRSATELRKIQFYPRPQQDPAGSVLIQWGNTHVICSVSVEEKKPKWMPHDSTSGWVTAEYGMLPGSSSQRIHRERVLHTGRTQEIQRLIGRSLRAAVSLDAIGPRTFTIDCDVLQADGGTRVASITGACLALKMALKRLTTLGKYTKTPELTLVSAVSVGKIKGEIVTDLDYQEDSNAEVDANIVMNEKGAFIELQGTAEKGSFSEEEWNGVLQAGKKGCEDLFNIQREILKTWNL